MYIYIYAAVTLFLSPFSRFDSWSGIFNWMCKISAIADLW